MMIGNLFTPISICRQNTQMKKFRWSLPFTFRRSKKIFDTEKLQLEVLFFVINHHYSLEPQDKIKIGIKQFENIRM
ncbi:hypothetical protein UB32_16895 [Mesobacillus subterraneus]|uniref:Uncharacterized protein n=1 Tax=Mesobacillus subterraneus TaxID=285983 RepID=A0A0D6Z769_9BACI|nr:hypothetical protein UB32_16895 [Mesobacillus subterraneus]